MVASCERPPPFRRPPGRAGPAAQPTPCTGAVRAGTDAGCGRFTRPRELLQTVGAVLTSLDPSALPSPSAPRVLVCYRKPYLLGLDGRDRPASAPPLAAVPCSRVRCSLAIVAAATGRGPSGDCVDDEVKSHLLSCPRSLYLDEAGKNKLEWGLSSKFG